MKKKLKKIKNGLSIIVLFLCTTILWEKILKDIPINEIKSGISDLYSDDDNIEYSVHIASAKRNDLKKRIKNYSEKVIEDDEIKIVFDYPLSGKFEFKFYSKMDLLLDK